MNTLSYYNARLDTKTFIKNKVIKKQLRLISGKSINKNSAGIKKARRDATQR